MSLATRCPACGTIFRVVQDQLKVSDGWVRCGQCHEVFHGVEALFDLESDPVVAARQGARPGSAAEDSTSATQSPEGPPTAPPTEPGALSPFARRPIAPRFAARLAEEAARVQGRAAPSRIPPGFAPASPSADGLGPAIPSSGTATLTPSSAQYDDTPPGPGNAFEPPQAALPPPSQGEAETWGGAATAPSGNPPVPSPPSDWALEPTESDDELGFWTGTGSSTASQRSPRTISSRGEDAGLPRAAVASDAPVGTPNPPASAAASATGRFADEDDDNGPLTLASLLPDASEWPIRPESRRRRRARVSVEADTEVPGNAGAPTVPAAGEHRFLREARRDAFWKRPRIRVALVFASIVLALTAAAQVAWPLRDTLAARYPAARDLLALACGQLGCKLESPRSLSSLALDSSSLTRTDAEHVLLFSADMHNRSDQDVRVPSFDLTFMDLNGDIVARKILAPDQIGIRQPSLPPEAEMHVHARLDVGPLDATGFHAEMFYP